MDDNSSCDFCCRRGSVKFLFLAAAVDCDVSDITTAAGVPEVSSVSASLACVPTVAGISAVALIVSCIPNTSVSTVIGTPGVAVTPSVFCVPTIAAVPAVADIPAAAGVPTPADVPYCWHSFSC